MLEREDWDSEILEALEATSRVSMRGRWHLKMHPQLLETILWYRDYSFDSVQDLLRAIRNVLNHYRELRPKIQVISQCQNLPLLHITSFFLSPHI